MILRPYQIAAVQAVNNAFVSGKNKPVIVMPTGTGKTAVFSTIAINRTAETQKKTLILAHREELLTQAKNKIHDIDPFLRVNIEQGNNHATESESDIIIASVPTLGRENSARIQKFNPLNFSTIIIDEAHHASSSTYCNILKHFGVLKGENEGQHDWNKACLLLGVTATPNRTDNRGIDLIFDEQVFTYTIEDAISQGFLVPIKAFQVKTKTDLTQVKRTAGDFNQGELGDAVNNSERNQLIVKTYLERTPESQAICFAVNVEHAEALAGEFTENNVAASFVTGELPHEDRVQRLKDFLDHKHQVMVNVGILSEGYDNPSVSTVLMARPTQSGILFTQQVGRGTRIFPGKASLTVLDFVDNTSKQRLKTAASLLGLDQNVDFKGQNIMAVKEKIDKLREMAPNADLEKLDIDRIDYAIQEVDILKGLEIPEEIAGYTKNQWHHYSEDEYKVGLGDGRSVSISETITGQFAIRTQAYDRDNRKTIVQDITSAKDIQTALYMADSYIIKNHGETLGLVRSDATWRSDKPSDKQLALLRKFGTPQSQLDVITKGQASVLLDRIFASKR